jgi:hypothetical protein
MKQEMGGTFSMYGERRGTYRDLVGKPREMRPLERPTCRWEDNINTDLGWKGMDWIDLLLDRNRWWTLASAAMNLWAP